MSGQVLLDSNVLLAALFEDDQDHDRGFEIVDGIDRGELPEGLVLSYALPEVLHPVQQSHGFERARDVLRRFEQSPRFHIEWLPKAQFQASLGVWERSAGANGAEFVDTAIVQFMRSNDIEYVYSFDDDFDEFDGITRLNTAVDPFEP